MMLSHCIQMVLILCASGDFIGYIILGVTSNNILVYARRRYQILMMVSQHRIKLDTVCAWDLTSQYIGREKYDLYISQIQVNWFTLKIGNCPFSLIILFISWRYFLLNRQHQNHGWQFEIFEFCWANTLFYHFKLMSFARHK